MNKAIYKASSFSSFEASSLRTETKPTSTNQLQTLVRRE